MSMKKLNKIKDYGWYTYVAYVTILTASVLLAILVSFRLSTETDIIIINYFVRVSSVFNIAGSILAFLLISILSYVVFVSHSSAKRKKYK